MRNGSFSYTKLRKLYLKMESDQSEGWGPEQERPFEFVAKHLLADDGYSGPPFFLGPNAKAERDKFTEAELKVDLLAGCDDASVMRREVQSVARLAAR